MVDREMLIEAVAEREWRWYWEHKDGRVVAEWFEVSDEAADGWRERARAILATVLPLFVRGITKLEAEWRDTMRESEEAGDVDEDYWRGRMHGARHAAELVRSLGGNDSRAGR